ncbi:MAG: metal-dependent hydrolase [Candidatus Pacearchaeota archaeon]
MRIDSHIFQIILIGIIFIPMFNILNFSSAVVFLIFLGLFCGAIFPDTDCKESRIFKMKQDNHKIGWQSSYKEYKSKKDAQNMYNTFLFFYSSLLIILGNIFRYLLYYPSYYAVLLMNKKWIKEDSVQDEHRGISHTLLGIFIASIFFFILLFLGNLYFKTTSTNLLIVPTLSFFIASNLHLLQDSISKWGVKWFYPFNKKRVYGDYSAFSNDSRIFIFVLFLIGSTILVFFLSNYLKNNLPNLFFIGNILLPIVFAGLSFGILFKMCNVMIES